MIDGNGRRNALNAVDIGSVTLVEELTRGGAGGFHIQALPFAIKRVEGKRTLTRSGRSGNDGPRIRLNVQINVF